MSKKNPASASASGSTPDFYQPVFDGPVAGWVANQIQRDLWKVAPLHDRADMMQEAYVVFARCAARYPMLDTPQHFMSLFQQAWKRRVIDMARKATDARLCSSAHQLSREDDEVYQQDFIGETENAGFMLAHLRRAPREVLLVLNLMLNAPAELLELAGKAWYARHRSASQEALVSKLLGLPEGSEPLKGARDYLSD